MGRKVKFVLVSNYLDQLNPEQRAAVEQTEGPVMIIAGAGSGKTRVITYRIIHLMQKGVEPFSILALTFTNKAAREMRERIFQLSGPEAKSLWMGTFHSVFARILRIEADKLGYPSNFTIYDTDDSKSLLRTIIKEMNLDDKLYNTGFVYNRISSAKNNLVSAEAYAGDIQLTADDTATGRPHMAEIYSRYTQRCYKAGAMDFDDLLFKTNVLIKDYPEVLYKYQNKFRYIMVDEYQDTNFSQYLIVKKLAAMHENLCVVGDDAQSIYAFRGANIQNILNFEKDYPDLNVYKLEENYRSTQNIVNVANSIIAQNKHQLQKNVFSNKETGEKIRVVRAYSDNEEGKLVAESIIEDKANKSLQNQDFSILYRTNAQSRAMEEALRKLNIPYKIYGGLSFYQRKEIKDLIAYFRLTLNPHDEEALKRVINYPVRGIGKTTIDKIILTAGTENISLWNVIHDIRKYMGGRAAESLEQFVIMIKSFAVMERNKNAFELASHIASHTGLLKDLYNDKSVEGVARYDNIQELLNGIKEFSDSPNREDRSLGAFLQDVALLTGDENEEKETGNTVSLMTIHSSKGLEFSHVFVVGIEENLFPSQLSLNSRTELEEERRLFYVAITRARHKLTLSYAKSRYKFGSLVSNEPSRFLDEIDPRYIEMEIRSSPRNFGTFFDDERESWNNRGNSPVKPASEPPPILKKASLHTPHIPTAGFVPDNIGGLAEGMKVEHEKFGFGLVTRVEGPPAERKATILFDQLGPKQLLLKFAKLRILSTDDTNDIRPA